MSALACVSWKAGIVFPRDTQSQQTDMLLSGCFLLYRWSWVGKRVTTPTLLWSKAVFWWPPLGNQPSGENWHSRVYVMKSQSLPSKLFNWSITYRQKKKHKLWIFTNRTYSCNSSAIEEHNIEETPGLLPRSPHRWGWLSWCLPVESLCLFFFLFIWFGLVCFFWAWYRENDVLCSLASNCCSSTWYWGFSWVYVVLFSLWHGVTHGPSFTHSCSLSLWTVHKTSKCNDHLLFLLESKGPWHFPDFYSLLCKLVKPLRAEGSPLTQSPQWAFFLLL